MSVPEFLRKPVAASEFPGGGDGWGGPDPCSPSGSDHARYDTHVTWIFPVGAWLSKGRAIILLTCTYQDEKNHLTDGVILIPVTYVFFRDGF